MSIEAVITKRWQFYCEAKGINPSSRGFAAYREGYLIGSTDTSSVLSDIATAAQAVVDNWEKGDLAGAVRNLSLELEKFK